MLHVAAGRVLLTSRDTWIATLPKLLAEEDREASEWFVKAAKSETTRTSDYRGSVSDADIATALVHLKVEAEKR